MLLETDMDALVRWHTALGHLGWTFKPHIVKQEVVGVKITKPEVGSFTMPTWAVDDLVAKLSEAKTTAPEQPRVVDAVGHDAAA